MQVCHSRSVRSRLSLGALLFLLSTLPVLAERVEDLPKPTDYVSDYAHVLSRPTVAQLDHICSQLDHTAANAQIAIVTVRSLDGDDAADFANRLEEKWKVGKKGSDRGILMLFAIQDRKRWIEVGYGLEGILNDAKVGDIGRSIIPNLRGGDYDGAVLSGTRQIAGIIASDAHVTLDDNGAVRGPVRRQPARSQPIASIFIVVLVLVIFVIALIVRFIKWIIFGGWGGGPRIGGGYDDGGFRGGGWGGGGGSDGGNSGGGDSGFGGFGGGDSGGGGAGGDW